MEQSRCFYHDHYMFLSTFDLNFDFCVPGQIVVQLGEIVTRFSDF